MSFVTVFTVSTMAFVLAVPALMILALTTVSPLRRSVAVTVQEARDTFSDQDRAQHAARPDSERKQYAAA
jgi:Na+-transporting methylmalonyl-CoA/oxaloacetate decarboxylase gamma subunit